ncbi:MAG: VOC family protein [Pseudomonadota bacterium]
MDGDKIGRVVWRDLFAADRSRAVSFCEDLTGWTFVTEHARDFAWGGGEKDFVLAISENEAGAGFVETPDGLRDGWVPYVEVTDVDATAEMAARVGGIVVKEPFDVPGVGRNCLLSDPFGTYVGISQSRHAFPVPKGLFGVDCYLTEATVFPGDFYARVFRWIFSTASLGNPGATVTTLSGEEVAEHIGSNADLSARSAWVPTVKVSDVSVARTLAEASGATRLDLHDGVSASASRLFFRDPGGVAFSLSREPA